ncbi:MAG: prepilin peptidase [Lachnospiraceae bacterium]|nr:prepilin peptidase [Lachnospiraceae bacterium]
MRIVLYVIFGIYIAVLSLEDLLKKSVPVALLAAGVLFIPAGLLTEGAESISVADNILGLIPGAMLLVISFVSRGQIGVGDGGLVMMLGASLGIETVIRILTAALLLITVFSGIMLVMRKLKRKSTLPFIPFLFAGYILSFF